jgi:hypothetical protein
VRKFVDTANLRGGRDNITAIVVEVQDARVTPVNARSSRPPMR